MDLKLNNYLNKKNAYNVYQLVLDHNIWEFQILLIPFENKKKKRIYFSMYLRHKIFDYIFMFSLKLFYVKKINW